jgi:hypothetical protein
LAARGNTVWPPGLRLCIVIAEPSP